MCNTLTGASIWGWLEIFAYLTLTAVSVVGYQQATEHWGIKNQIISINGIEVDQATLCTMGIVLGSVGLLCSLMLVIGVAKVCFLTTYSIVYYVQCEECTNLCSVLFLSDNRMIF